MATRETKVDVLARQLVDGLKLFDGHERDFALEEVVRVARAIRSRSKSSQYHIDFTRDEAPTRPDTPVPEVGDRATRRVDIAAISAEIEKSRKK